MPSRKNLPFLRCGLQVVVVTIGASVVVLEDTDDVEVVVVTQAFTFNAKSAAYPLPLKLMVIV